MIASLLALACAVQDIPVDLSKLDAGCGVGVVHKDGALAATWAAPEGRCSAIFKLSPDGPVFASLAVDGAELARDVTPVYTIPVGSRVTKPGERYTFFDKPSSRPHESHPGKMVLKACRVESAGSRASFIFPGLRAGPFSGDLVVTIYSGSPLLHVEAALSLEEKQTAYIYDFVLE